MKYAKRQERAEMLVRRFRELAVIEPDGTFQGRTYESIAKEIEGQTEYGRGVVVEGGLVLRALQAGPPPSPPPLRGPGRS